MNGETGRGVRGATEALRDRPRPCGMSARRFAAGAVLLVVFAVPTGVAAQTDSLLRDAINAGLELSGAEALEPAPEIIPGAVAYKLPNLPESWEKTMDSLRPPRGRDEYFSDWRAKNPLPALFEPPPKMNSAAAQLRSRCRAVA